MRPMHWILSHNAYMNTFGAPTALCPRLEHFVAVAHEQHVTRAANRLGIPQPTLSRAIARLEADLGVSLFQREGRALRLTPQGRELLVYAERALRELATGWDRLAENAGIEHGKVTFAFLHTLGSDAVPALLREFRTEHPGIRFQLVQGGTAMMLAGLRAGDIDLCLVSPLPDEPGVVARPLEEEPLVLVVPVEHRLARRRRVRLAEIAAEEFVGLEPGYGLRRITDELCRRAGFVPRVAFEGEEVDTVRGLVAAGLGVALLPADPRGRPEVAEVPVAAPRASRTIALAWPRGRTETPAAAVFREFVLAHAGRIRP